MGSRSLDITLPNINRGYHQEVTVNSLGFLSAFPSRKQIYMKLYAE